MSDGRAPSPIAPPDLTRRSAAALAVGLLAAVLALVGVERLAAGRIEASRAARVAAALAEVLPDAPFDNDPATDRVLVRDDALGTDVPVPVYRVRRAGRAVGAVLSVLAPDGYGGAIELLVGVAATGRVTGVRVGEHRETPGLGDRIERRRSDWIAQFDGRALDPAGPRAWRVVRGGGGGGGGGFDALTGATITSRAVVEAVWRALAWFDAHRDELFAA